VCDVANGKNSVTVVGLRLLSEERSNDQREPDATPKPGTLRFKNDFGRVLVETARHRRMMLPLRAASVYTPGGGSYVKLDILQCEIQYLHTFIHQ
jgi:hypothetical protein